MTAGPPRAATSTQKKKKNVAVDPLGEIGAPEDLNKCWTAQCVPDEATSQCLRLPNSRPYADIDRGVEVLEEVAEDEAFDIDECVEEQQKVPTGRKHGTKIARRSNLATISANFALPYGSLCKRDSTFLLRERHS